MNCGPVCRQLGGGGQAVTSQVPIQVCPGGWSGMAEGGPQVFLGGSQRPEALAGLHRWHRSLGLLPEGPSGSGAAPGG